MPASAIDRQCSPTARTRKKLMAATAIIRKMPPRIPFGGFAPASLRPNQTSPPSGGQLDDEPNRDVDERESAETRRRCCRPRASGPRRTRPPARRRRTPPRAGWRAAGSSAGWACGVRTRSQRRWPCSVLSDPSFRRGRRPRPRTPRPARALGIIGAGPAMSEFASGVSRRARRRRAPTSNAEHQHRAGAEGIEPPTGGFGNHCSTS